MNPSRNSLFYVFDWESQNSYLDHAGGSAKFDRSYRFVGTLMAM